MVRDIKNNVLICLTYPSAMGRERNAGMSNVGGASLFRSERFDLRKLRYFAHIVETGSISKAAAELRVAQPALSKSIRLLEFDLKTPLLERSAQGVTPTRAGQTLYEHRCVVFRQLELARAALQGTEEEPRGSIRLGLPYSGAWFWRRHFSTRRCGSSRASNSRSSKAAATRLPRI